MSDRDKLRSTELMGQIAKKARKQTEEPQRDENGPRRRLPDVSIHEFAAAAMQGIISNDKLLRQLWREIDDDNPFDTVARMAYKQAMAMVNIGEVIHLVPRD